VKREEILWLHIAELRDCSINLKKIAEQIRKKEFNPMTTNIGAPGITFILKIT
jgi:hypothetical protein